MKIEDVIKAKSDLYQEYEMKYRDVLQKYLDDNAKFKKGDIVEIKSRGDFGVVEKISVDERMLYHCRIRPELIGNIIQYSIRILTKKMQPRKDGLVMTWEEYRLELKQQSKQKQL